MEQKPVIDFDEKHGKEPVTKEKDKAGRANKKLPKQLAVGVLLTEPKAKQVNSKNFGEQKPYSGTAPKTEATAEAVDRQERVATETSRQAIITELIVEADDSPEWHLPDSDQAWQLVDPDRPDRPARWLTAKKREVSEENIEIGPSRIPEVAARISADVLLADGKIHELLRVTDTLHQHLDQGPETLIIRHETGQSILLEEGQLAQEMVVHEVAQAEGYDGKLELSPHSQDYEIAAGRPAPEPLIASSDRLEAPVFPWASIFEPPLAKPPETTPAADRLAMPPDNAGPRFIERRQDSKAEKQAGNLFDRLAKRRGDRELRHGQKQQKQLVEELIRQQKQADKALKSQTAEQPSLAGPVKRLDKVANLFIRPKHQPEGPRKRFRYHVVERERELIRERQLARLQKQAAQPEQIYQSGPVPMPETWVQPLSQRRSRHEESVKARPETAPPPVTTAVAETAVEQVLHLPPDHRLLKSAWHSIEVDKSGKAVERPVFAYGREFQQEQRQEAHSYKAPLTAVQTGLLAFSDNSHSLNTDFGAQPVSLQPSSSPSRPDVRLEKSAFQPSQWRLTQTDQTVGLIIIITIILLSITGLILLH
jgi:hypothetical protein